MEARFVTGGQSTSAPATRFPREAAKQTALSVQSFDVIEQYSNGTFLVFDLLPAP